MKTAKSVSIIWLSMKTAPSNAPTPSGDLAGARSRLVPAAATATSTNVVQIAAKPAPLFPLLRLCSFSSAAMSPSRRITKESTSDAYLGARACQNERRGGRGERASGPCRLDARHRRRAQVRAESLDDVHGEIGRARDSVDRVTHVDHDSNLSVGLQGPAP